MEGSPRPLVKVCAAQKVSAGSANQLAPAILQPRAASRTKARVVLQRERALNRSRFGRNIRRGCLHQEILAHGVNFQLPLAPATHRRRYRYQVVIDTTKQKRRNTMDRSGSAVWHGSLKEGNGTISTQSGTLKETQYSFKARFADGVGTNPEELIAAAHAGCFTMALSAEITKAGLTPDTIETSAVLTLDVSWEKPTITKIRLTTKAKDPGIDKATFDELAHNAEVGCPVSRVLKAAEITLDATLL